MTERIILTFKTTYQIYKELNLNKKRQLDKGASDYEIIEEILHHERVELINFGDQNLDPERLVSSLITKRHIFMVLRF